VTQTLNKAEKSTEELTKNLLGHGWVDPSSHRNVQEKCKGNSEPMGQKSTRKIPVNGFSASLSGQHF